MDLGPANEIEEGETTLRKTKDGERFVCMRTQGTLHVLADRCPHQGYPLSQGDLKNGVLTCAWHNWKFDIKDGQCLTGGDAVFRPPCRVKDGRLEANVTVDVEAEQRRAKKGIAEGLFDNDPSRVVRDGLRMAKVADGRMAPAFEVLAQETANRNRWGFGHELAGLADLLVWVDDGDLDAAEAFGQAAIMVGERLTREPMRSAEAPQNSQLTAHEALETEDRGQAEARVRKLTAKEGPKAAVRAMVPFVSRYILDYGHGAIYLAKALELALRFEQSAVDLMAASAVNLGWATRETALPPWRATQRALEAVNEVEVGSALLKDRAHYEEEVLADERRAVDATLAALGVGTSPRALLVASAHAASVRLSRFDVRWPDKKDYEVGILDVSHAVTFADACLALIAYAEPRDAARMSVLAAAFVGKLAAADGPSMVRSPAGEQDLAAHVQARNEPAAWAAIEAMSKEDRLASYRNLRPFAAYEAFVRPIFTIHAVKTNEALRRLEALDTEADDIYLKAYVHTVTPPWRERNPQRMASVAKKFMKDGRPPEGLY